MTQTRELRLRVDGMHCASCVNSVEKGVNGLEGVDTCRVNLATSSALVKYAPEKVSEEEVYDQIKQLGFEPSPGKPDIFEADAKAVRDSRDRFILSLALTVPLMFVAMWDMLATVALISPLADNVAQAILALIVVFFAGRSIIADAWLQTRHFRANMNSLVAMGTLTACGWSLYLTIAGRGASPLYFDSAGMIITLILLGRFLEARARRRAGESIRALSDLRPSKANAIINDVEVEIDVDSVQPDMILVIRPGDSIPADGVVTEGNPVIDESMLTGESVPVEKRVNSPLYGGSINGHYPFRMKVTATGEATYLASVVRLVSEAQATKAPVQKLADRVAGVFVPIVIGIAVLTALGWYLFAADSPHMIKSVVSVLIIACPCALGLATPTAVLAGTGRAAREGIIVRGGDVLEMLSRVDTVAFDKTGTLTHGDLEVVSVKTFGQVTEKNLLRMAGSVEQLSEHPLGRAIARHMRMLQIDNAKIKNVEALPGFGLKGEYDGRELLVGSKNLMDERGVSYGPALAHAEDEMSQGRSVVFVAMDEQVIGVFSLADRLRSDARELVADLKQTMSQVLMLSGDSYKTAQGVADALGLDSFEAGIKPAMKQTVVDSLRKAGMKVAMVGDGINDAPALVAADVGVALGSGTDVAVESADVVLVSSRLSDVSKMFRLARLSMRTIRQNLFWALFYNVVAIPIAAGVLYPVIGLTLTPAVAALAMSFSSVFVVSNSLRLSRSDMI